MKKTALYQAIDGGRTAVPERPIRCTTSDARLGYGHYFWESIIDAAHWWGKERYGKNNYIICQSFYDAHSDKYFDLIGNLDHRKKLKACADELRARGRDDFALAEVLEGLKKVCPEFDDLYWAIRAEPISKNFDKKLNIRLHNEDPTSCEGRNLPFTLAEVLEGLKKVYPKFENHYWTIRAEAKDLLDKKLAISLPKEDPTSCEDRDIPFAEGAKKLVLPCGQRVQVCVTNLAFLLEDEYTPIYYPECRDASYMA